MVPNGWKRLPLSKLLKASNQGINTTTERVKYSESGIPAIRSNNVDEGKLDLSDEKFVTEVEFARFSEKFKPVFNDILYCNIGSNLGSACVNTEKYPFLITWNVFRAVPDQRILFPQFGALLLNWNRRDLRRFATESTMPFISSKELLKYRFALPPLPEQRKIAKVLSTWDKAISTTEKLIETSKQQKKALMQQLLTGKKRLVNPETGKAFEGEWEEVKLRKLGKCITGLTYSPSDVVEEGTLVLRSSNIQGGKLSFLDNVFVSSSIKEDSRTRIGDILICVRNGSRNLIGKSAYITEKASGQAHGAFMTLFRGQYPKFVYQLFQTSLFFRQVNKNLGATINSINTSDLHKFKFYLPKDETEIVKIASVLTAADKEIEVLETKLAHFKQEKKALMQQLLTGKRRVKVNEDVAA